MRPTEVQGSDEAETTLNRQVLPHNQLIIKDTCLKRLGVPQGLYQSLMKQNKL